MGQYLVTLTKVESNPKQTIQHKQSTPGQDGSIHEAFPTGTKIRAAQTTEHVYVKGPHASFGTALEGWQPHVLQVDSSSQMLVFTTLE